MGRGFLIQKMNIKDDKILLSIKLKVIDPHLMKGSLTIVVDFSPEINLQFRWCSEHQLKNRRAYQ